VQPIFVGDVQGCADELSEIVLRGDREFGKAWELWLVGDLINRGPANLRVLELVRERTEAGRARMVLGNHDLAFVRAFHGLQEPGPHDTLDELLQHPEAEAWVEWLRRRPLVEIGTLGERPFAMVHASVHPDWGLREVRARADAAEAELGHAQPERCVALLRADPKPRKAADVLGRLTRCRSVARDGSWSSRPPEVAGRGSSPWHEAWRKRRHGYGVVYGHWALQGLHVAGGLRGLDTGCVHHGRDHDGFLTAWIPDLTCADPFAKTERQFWQVRARRRYYPD
jgi:bis(5'-nucleosyl)-tetraphosphatase (symmetrical)